MLDRLSDTEAWKEVDVLLVRTLNAFVQLAFAPVRAPRPADDAAPFVAEVGLVHAEMELVLAVAAERDSMKRLAQSVLDSDEDADAESLVLEASNILMGTLRTSLAAEGISAVLGLPAAVAHLESRDRFVRGTLRAELSVVAAIGALDIWLSAAPRATLTDRSHHPLFAP